METENYDCVPPEMSAIGSVRRILERGGGAGNSENLKITKIGMKIFPPRISPVFLSKIR